MRSLRLQLIEAAAQVISTIHPWFIYIVPGYLLVVTAAVVLSPSTNSNLEVGISVGLLLVCSAVCLVLHLRRRGAKDKFIFVPTAPPKPADAAASSIPPDLRPLEPLDEETSSTESINQRSHSTDPQSILYS